MEIFFLVNKNLNYSQKVFSIFKFRGQEAF